MKKLITILLVTISVSGQSQAELLNNQTIKYLDSVESMNCKNQNNKFKINDTISKIQTATGETLKGKFICVGDQRLKIKKWESIKSLYGMNINDIPESDSDKFIKNHIAESLRLIELEKRIDSSKLGKSLEADLITLRRAILGVTLMGVAAKYDLNDILSENEESYNEILMTLKRQKIRKKIRYDRFYGSHKNLLAKYPEKENEILAHALKLKEKYDGYIELFVSLSAFGPKSYLDPNYYVTIFGNPAVSDSVDGLYSDFFGKYLMENYFEKEIFRIRDDYLKENKDKEEVLPLIHEKIILYALLDKGAFIKNNMDDSSYVASSERMTKDNKWKSLYDIDYVNEFVNNPVVLSVIEMREKDEIDYFTTKLLLKDLLYFYGWYNEVNKIGIDYLHEDKTVVELNELLEEVKKEFFKDFKIL